MADDTKARQNVQEMTGTVREEARRAGETVREEAKVVADQATTLGREHAEQRFEQGKGALEEQVDTIHSAVDGAAKRLREENSPLASYAGELSDQISRFSSNIESSTLDDIAVKARQVARENPGMFVLGSVVAGIAAGRFFKASSSRDHHEDDDYRAGREAVMARHAIDYRSSAGAGAAPYRRAAGTSSATGVSPGTPGRVPMDSAVTQPDASTTEGTTTSSSTIDSPAGSAGKTTGER